MEIGNRIRTYRNLHQLSQEQLAGKLFVSRQTISNWENNKTYPDIQTIISLAILFDVSLDDFIREDLEAMKMKLKTNKERQRTMLYSGMMLVLTLLASVSLGLVLAFPTSKGLILVPILFYLPVFWIATILEKSKKGQDLKSYQEILAFLRNKDVAQLAAARTPQRMRREKVRIILTYIVLILIFCLLASWLAHFWSN